MTEPAAETPSNDALLGFNPFDPEFRRDPYPVYRRLREQAPVQQSLPGLIVCSRYADCATLLRHPKASSDGRKATAFQEYAAQNPGAFDADEFMNETRPFLFLDPPDHTRLRGLVNKAFTPHVVERLRPRIQEIVDELLDAAAARGELDVIEDLAYPLPVRIISEMLGVPAEDHERFKDWSRELARSLDPEAVIPPDLMQRRQAAAEAFRDYFTGLIAARRKDPRDDLLSALIAAEEQGDRLTQDELLATCTVLLIAGHETTVNLIGNGTLALLRHPGEQARLRADRSLVRTGVEEMLRYDPPVQLTARIALEDIALSAGVLRKGEQAVLLLGSANRDPEQFPDPERFDVARAENRHLAFGMGIHFCLGAPLARVEGQIAIGSLLARSRELRPLVEQPEYKENVTLRGLAALPVAFVPA